jgi:hypothetical protein
MNWFHDPFFYIVLLGICYVFVFSRFASKNEQELKAYLKNSDEVIFLPKVSVKHLQKFIGARRDWFKADAYFTPHSIFIFGGSIRFTLHAQYYFDRKSPPKKLVWLERSFLPIDKLFWEGDNLHICYVAPARHKARCTVILKNLKKRQEAVSIQNLFENLGITALATDC